MFIKVYQLVEKQAREAVSSPNTVFAEHRVGLALAITVSNASLVPAMTSCY